MDDLQLDLNGDEENLSNADDVGTNIDNNSVVSRTSNRSQASTSRNIIKKNNDSNGVAYNNDSNSVTSTASKKSIKSDRSIKRGSSYSNLDKQSVNSDRNNSSHTDDNKLTTGDDYQEMVDDHGFSNSNENSEERNVQQGQQSVGSKNSKTNVNSSEIQIIQPEKDASNNSNDGPTSQQSVGFDLENNQNNGTNSQLNLAVRQNETGDDRENHQDTAEDVSNGPAVTSQRYQRLRTNNNTNASNFPEFLKSTMLLGIGYRMHNFTRKRNSRSSALYFDAKREAIGYTLGFNIQKVSSQKSTLPTLIRPVVKIHAVDINTGYYIKSSNLPPCRPSATSAYRMGESAVYPEWDQELILDASYCDLASEDTLLLFEVLDEQPKLNSKSSQERYSCNCWTTVSTETSPLGYNSVKQDISPASDPNAVRIAWAFLLPIGINGDISIAAKSEWIENTAPENSGPKNGIAATSNTLEEESTPQVRQVMERGLSGGSDQDKSKAIQRIGRHTGGSIQSHKNIRLQLYQYRYYDGLFGSIQRQLMQWPSLQTNYCDELALGENAAANTIPSVYSQWRIQTHYPIEGGSLSLSVTVRNDYLMSPSAVAVLHGNLPSGSLIPNRETPISSPVRQEDADDIALNSFQRVNNKKRGLFTSVKASRGLSAKEQALARAGVFNRKRKAKEPCIIPDRFLARLDVGPEGAMVIAFSNSGHLLAVAAKSQSVSTPSSNQGAMVVPNSGELNNTPCHSISNLQPLDTIHCIKLFDTDTLEELWSEDTAHHGAIYELQWSKNDRYLLSSSSDGTSKVWDLITFVYRIILPNGVPSTNGNSDGNLSPFVSGEQFNFSVVQNNGVSVMETVKNFNASYSNNMIAALDLMGTITLAAVLRNTPPVHVYTSIFQEFNAISRPPKNIPEKIQEDGEEPNEILNKLQEIADAPLPRIITGASDGRIRVWDGETFEGFITVRRKNKPEDLMDDFQPHNGAINSITIDGRSKYLISSDSSGDILAWRMDAAGWYQLLRKFQKDISPASLAMKSLNSLQGVNVGNIDDAAGGILSLGISPDRAKGQMLVMSRHPSELKLISTSTYKVQSYCNGYDAVTPPIGINGGFFHRASMSVDGSIVICGAQHKLGINSKKNGATYKIQCWDSKTGEIMNSPLSDYAFPYQIRSISWHPKQHLVAVGMVGPGAGVILYSGVKRQNNVGITTLNNTNTLNFTETLGLGNTTIVAPPSPAESMNSKLMESTDDTQAAERSLVQKERAQKAKDLLLKIRSEKEK